MKVLILPGFSQHNKNWAVETSQKLGNGTIVHNWLHWENGKTNLSLKEEIKNILKEIEKEEKINIVAKSVGTMVCMHLLKEISGRINKIILCGIPSVSKERENLFTTSLFGFNHNNIIVFQNNKDLFASYEEVKMFMNKVNPKIKVLKKERSDHNYPYFEDFKKFII